MLHLGFLMKFWARALSRIIIEEATKDSEEEDTSGTRPLYFSLEQSQGEGLGEPRLGLGSSHINKQQPKLSVADFAQQFQNQKPK